jgi:Ran GTPase-activating protein (RanGAP) involved in mRNA processing and transport
VLVRLGSVGTQHVAKALACAGASLRSLDLSSNRLGDAGAAQLATALASLRRLRSLGLRDNWIADAGAERLAGALDGLADLVFLDVEGNRIGADGRRVLMGSLDEGVARAHGEGGFGFVY